MIKRNDSPNAGPSKGDAVICEAAHAVETQAPVGETPTPAPTSTLRPYDTDFAMGASVTLKDVHLPPRYVYGPAEPGDPSRGLVVSRISDDDGRMFDVPRATSYCVKIRNRVTDVETDHRFESMTARALFIISNEDSAEILREWIDR